MMNKMHSEWKTLPRCRHQENLTNMSMVFDFGPFAPLCENMTSSTKAEVHTLLDYRQRSTESHTYTKILVKSGLCFFEIRELADKQTNIHTYRQADRNTSIYIPGTK